MDEEIKKLLAENLAKSEEMYELMRKLKRYLLVAQIFSVLKLLLIVVPIILAIIYLPPFLGDALGQYREILGSDVSSGLRLPF